MTLWVAVPVSVLGNFLNSVGYIIQKKGHNAVLLQPNPDGSVRSYTKSNTWRLGFVVYVLGSLLHGYALSQGSQSLITPLESVTLIANTFLAPLFLGERLRRIDVIGTVIILIGCTLAVIFGPANDGEYTADDLINLYIEPGFLTLCGIVFFFLILDYSGVRYVEKKCKREGIIQDGSMKVYGAGFLCISYSTIGALAGSFNVLFTKSVFEMLSLTFSGDNQFLVVWFWLLLVLFALGNFALEYWKQKALGIYGALYVVPIYQVIVIIGGITVGAVYFNEFSELSAVDAGMFGVAIFCTVSGVYLLSLSEAQKALGLKALISRKIMPLIRVTRAFGSRTRMAGQALLDRLRRNKSESQRMSVAFSSVSGWGQLFQKLNFVRMIRDHMRSRAERRTNDPTPSNSGSVIHDDEDGDRKHGSTERIRFKPPISANGDGIADGKNEQEVETPLLPGVEQGEDVPVTLSPLPQPPSAALDEADEKRVLLGGDEDDDNDADVKQNNNNTPSDPDLIVPVASPRRERVVEVEEEVDAEERMGAESITTLPALNAARRETRIPDRTITPDSP